VKRHLRPEEVTLWSRVAATVHPAAGRHPPRALALADPAAQKAAPPKAPPHPPKFVKVAKPAVHARTATTKAGAVKPPVPPEAIEPGRKRRITRERDPIGPRLDLHGMTQDAARATLQAFLRRASADGWRSVLVITGKGTLGDGVLRRFTPEWLADPALRDLVAGVSEAHRRHGGQGALYVALKRPSRA
jgi:DNA-nicking Smr family endonuclease